MVKKAKIILPMAMLCLTLTACGNKRPIYTGDKIVVKPAVNVQEGSFKVNSITKPAAKTNIEAKQIKANTPIMSPYAQSFSPAKQKVYSEMLATVLSASTNYIPSETLSAEDAKKMVRIIMLDEPRAYALKKQYVYKTDDKGNIKEILFNYSNYLTTEAAKDAYKESINRSWSEDDKEDKVALESFKSLVDTRPKDDTNAKMFLAKIYASSNGDEDSSNSDDFVNAHLSQFLADIQDTVFAPYYHYNPSEEGYAKAFNGLLREQSIQAVSVYGERTSEYNLENYKIAVFDGFKEVEEKVEDGIRVTVDSNSINTWNMFKIDNVWNNADIVLGKYALATLQSKNENIDNLYFGYGLSDEQLSVSRLSYYNEDILGVCPMSVETALNSAKDSEKVIFIEDSTDSRLSDDLAKVITDKSEDDYLIFSFAQLDVFNTFVLSKDMLMNKYYEQQLIKFQNYDTIVIPDIQTVCLYNLK